MTKNGEMNILGAICARGGSKGVPRKNVRQLCGKPLIAHTILCASQCTSLTSFVVSTDDEEIALVAQQYGARVPFMRPAELAQDNSSKWDVFRNLVETMEKIDRTRVDVLVDLDTGVPLRQPEDVDACVRLLNDSEADVVVTAYPSERNPYFNMVEASTDGFFHVCKPVTPPITGRQSAPATYSLSPAAYAIRRDALWTYDHWAQARIKIHVLPRERAVDIDTEIDFQFVDFLMHKQQAGQNKE